MPYKNLIETKLIIIFFLVSIFQVSSIYALPAPHGVDGIIYELDGITETRKGIDFFVHDLSNGQIISGKTGYGSSGRYSVSLKGNDGDIIIVKAWNKYNQVNATLTLSGVMRNANLLLNMTFPPIAPNITSQPITGAIEDQLYTYQVEVFDENDDILEYSLLEYPLGMNIDKSSGLVTWLPLNDDVGTHNVIMQVSDGIFTTNQSFSIYVQNVNDKPKIISIPISNAAQDASYFYDVDAIDEDNDVLVYSLLKIYEGMSINQTSGLINWTPNNSQVGIDVVVVEVSDGNLTDSQEFIINVSNVNDLPVIISLPVTKATQNEPYTYDVDAHDIDNDTLTYSLVNYPKGMNINETSGNITWLPGNEDVGIHNVTVKVSDDFGFVLQPYALLVENINDKPVINSTPITEAKIGKTYAYDVDAYDIDNDSLSYFFVAAPKGMTISKTNGLIKWKPKASQKGNNTVIVEVSDGNLTDRQEFALLVFASEGKEQKKESGSNSSGDLSIGSSGSGGKNGTVLSKELGERDKKFLMGIKTKSLNAILKVEELSERPKDASRISKRVYKYLKIENVNQINLEEAVINFTVDLNWLNQTGIKYDDIALTRYTKEAWQDLVTDNISRDDKYVYYIAKTPGFSYFAISVKEGVKVKDILNPQISKINVPYSISGIIYKFGKLKQVSQETIFIIENLNTSETLIGKTGIGPFTGAYSVLLNGNYGDKIKINVMGKEFLTTLKDVDNLDLMLTFGLFESIDSLFFISLIFAASLIILIKIKYRYKKR